MSKQLSLVVLALATFVTAGLAADGAAVEPGELALDESCAYTPAAEIVQGFFDAHPYQPAGGVPACPAEPRACNSGSNLCGGSTPCGLAGSSDCANTGLSKCRLANGDLVKCSGGETVHVVTAPCGKCPCCAAGTCVCPSSCGQLVRVTCGCSDTGGGN